MTVQINTTEKTLMLVEATDLNQFLKWVKKNNFKDGWILLPNTVTYYTYPTYIEIPSYDYNYPWWQQPCTIQFGTGETTNAITIEDTYPQGTFTLNING